MDFDPRARLAGLAVFIIAVCVVSSPAVLALLTAVSLFLLIPSGMSVADAAKRLLPVNAFMALLWLTMPFLAEGPYVRCLDFVAVSLPGARQALIMTLKANALAAAASAILYPVETGAVAVALHRLGTPTKMVWLLLLSSRSIVGMTNKVAKSVLAIRMRSGKGTRLRLRAYGGLFAKLFVDGHESGGRLYLAMQARGYGNRLALRRAFVWRLRDTCLVAGMIAVSCGAVYLSGIL